MPGGITCPQPGQRYSFAALRAVILRTDHSPSEADSRCGSPARERSRSISGTGAAHLRRALRPAAVLEAGSCRRGRLERGIKPSCRSRTGKVQLCV